MSLLVPLKGMLMLETCSGDTLVELARARGKEVNSVPLVELPAFSLIQLYTSINTIYLVETLPGRCHTGMKLSIARFRVEDRLRKDFIRDACTKAKTLSVGHALSYESGKKTFSTSLITRIHLLTS